jgi:DNA polymerase delta subunit 1
MIDRDISGMSWIELDPTKCVWVPQSQRESSCQIEVAVSYLDVISHGYEAEWSSIAPLRILSFGRVV